MLDQKIGQYILQACDEVIAGKWNDQFIVDPIQGGAGTSVNMNANEVIANRALELMGEKKETIKLSVQIRILICLNQQTMLSQQQHILRY